uniref:Uncharacterized protein n=1 Tax=Pyxicephalus adspersus TaxID=30357 RepID=A0AAV3AGK3_PYXAD|nr:TPA: hypothetical protein GDO54_006462 [Pyxicephalus adspersus]
MQKPIHNVWELRNPIYSRLSIGLYLLFTTFLVSQLTTFCVYVRYIVYTSCLKVIKFIFTFTLCFVLHMEALCPLMVYHTVLSYGCENGLDTLAHDMFF